MNSGGELQLTARSVHVCVDMQRLFAPDGPWSTPWMERVLPCVTAIARRFVTQTIFTRFIPPYRPEDLPGMWTVYYRRWRHVTREHLDTSFLELVPPLAELMPPGEIVDKTRYSPFVDSPLEARLKTRKADALVLTGSETDVCVLATALGAIDLGYKVVLVKDAVCSSSDAGHDALMTMFEQRFTEQLKVTDTKTLLSSWVTDV